DRRRGGRPMSAERKSNPSTAERVGGTVKKAPQHNPDEPDFKSLFHAWLESHRASLVDSVGRLVKQPIGSFFTCLVMAVALSLPMGLALLLDNVERLGGSWQRAAQISLYLQLETDAAAGQALREQILEMPDVADAEWISREQALEEFQQLSGLGEALRELPDNPLPGVVVVTPNEVDKAKLEALRQRLAELPGVEQAQLDLLWVECPCTGRRQFVFFWVSRLSTIIKIEYRFVFCLTLLLISSMLLVFGYTIRLHMENRRTEIEVVKLVGGTDGYVRRPFLYMGALYGLGAGLIAWLLLAYGLGWLNEAVIDLAGLYGSDFGLAGVPTEDGFSLVLGALLLGYI